MEVYTTKLKDVIVIEPEIFKDQRGFFQETYHLDRYRAAGIVCDFVQDNMSFSTKGTLRGLHYQYPHGQAKLVSVLKGEVFDVAVDIRQGASTFGEWEGVILSGDNHRQLFIPEGFAHGFCVLSEDAIFSYKCSDFYTPQDEFGIIWSDPDINIRWPIDNPALSKKDQCYNRLSGVNPSVLPKYN